MTRLAHVVILLLPGLLVSGCVRPLAPGAEQVKITRNTGDVAGCAAVGNLDTINTGDDPRNQAIGLGGNVVFDTRPSAVFGLMTGVVYRCASAATPAAK
jgi:hypothetical protein